MVLYNLDAKSFILGTTGASPDVEGTKYIDHNGTFDISAFEFANVNVENWFEPEDNGKVVVSQQLQPQTAREITANGNYVTTTNDRVSVQVPNSYLVTDSGKVVVNGELVEQTTDTKTVNGTYDTTTIKRLTINVPTGITPTGTITITENGTVNITNYASAYVNVPQGITPTGSRTITENGSYDITNYANVLVNVEGGGFVPTGTIQITSNGTHDVTNYAAAAVNVPNTYSASDSGKVVVNGELVAQTSDTKHTNGTFDTTTINSLTIDVSGGFTPTGNLQITSTNQVDVSNYATAQVVDSDLIASNIKKNVDILGVVGTYEGSGGGDLPDTYVEWKFTGSQATGYRTDIIFHSNTYSFLWCGLGDIMSTTQDVYIDWSELGDVIDIPERFISGSSDYGIQSYSINMDLSTILQINKYAFSNCNKRINNGIVELPKCYYIGRDAFASSNIQSISIGTESTVTNGEIREDAFKYSNLQTVTIGQCIDKIYSGSFCTCPNLTTVYFEGTPSYIESSSYKNAFVSGSITDIYCPWSEGTVSGAPWGATTATIHYNYTPS